MKASTERAPSSGRTGRMRRVRGGVDMAERNFELTRYTASSVPAAKASASGSDEALSVLGTWLVADGGGARRDGPARGSGRR